MGIAPKHHLADPALAAALLGVGADALLNSPNPDRPPLPRKGTLVGALFESLVTLSVRVYAEAAGASVSHLRTHRGSREIDLIVERPDGKALGIEIKLGGQVSNDDVRHLRWFKAEMDDDLLDAMVINTGPGAYRRDDGIAVVPLGLLGP